MKLSNVELIENTSSSDENSKEQTEHTRAGKLARAIHRLRPRARRVLMHIYGPYTDILIASAVICLPMFLLSALPLILVFRYQVNSGPPKTSDLWLARDQGDPSAYLVDFSATKLVTLASWTSSVAPMLPRFVMTLVSYGLARDMIRYSQLKTLAALPTPYQLGLLLSLFGGGFGSLCTWAAYGFWKPHESLPPVILRSLAIFSVATMLRQVFRNSPHRIVLQTQLVELSPAYRLLSQLFGSISVMACPALTEEYSYAIFAADTWLHFATSTVSVQSVKPSVGQPSLVGRGLNWDYCANEPSDSRAYNASNLPCSLWYPDGEKTADFRNADEVTRIRGNYSLTNYVSSDLYHAINGRAALLQDATVAFQNMTDFRASSYAVATECKPITRQCDVRTLSNTSVPFNCTPAFAGDMLDYSDGFDSVGYRLFEDFDLRRPLQNNLTSSNPFYVGINALIQTTNQDSSSDQGYLMKDPNVVRPVPGYLAWILACSSMVYDVEYDFVDGMIRTARFKQSNATVGAIFAAPLTLNGSAMSHNAVTATIADGVQDVSSYFASLLQELIIGESIGAFSPRPTLEEQHRSKLLVARIPKRPLFTLVILNLLYGFIGLGLALYAAIGSRPRETRHARSRLSIAGLTASCFEGHERNQQPVDRVQELFAEKTEGVGHSVKVGIERTDQGGWNYVKIGGRQWYSDGG